MRKIFLFVFCAFSIVVHSQTVGWFYGNPGTTPGYALFAPGSSDSTFLIDKCGKRIHEWGSNYHAGLSVYLLPDGTLLREGSTGNNTFAMGGGAGGIIENLDWDGNVLWSYKISDNLQCQHHDGIKLPNGNVIAIVWEKHTKTEAEDNGRQTVSNSGMWSEKLVEVKPIGTDSGAIVWQWRAFDHLVQDYDSTKLNWGVVIDHPELLNINNGTLAGIAPDWLHFNGLFYDSAHDQLLVSSRLMSEIYILDHSTTLDEATSHEGGTSGHGGDLLYRWGNPQNYNRGTSDDRKLYQQHNVSLIKTGPHAGDIMVFNNGNQRPGGSYSTVDEFTPPPMVNNNYPIEPDSAYQPDAQNWIYTANPANSFYSLVEGGAQRLANGNTMICEGYYGRFFEVDSNGNDLWQYISPVDVNGNTHQGNTPFMNTCFRVTQIDFTDPGLTGQVLNPGAPIEINPLNYSCDNFATGFADVKFDGASMSAYPSPFVNNFSLHLPALVHHAILQIHDITGILLYEEGNFNSNGSDPRISLYGYHGVAIVSVKDVEGNHQWQATVVAQ